MLALTLSSIFHSRDASVVGCLFSLIKLDSSVAFFLLSYLNEFLCLYNLSLKVFPVSLFSNNLFWWRHVFNNSDLLFNNWLLLTEVNFCFRENLCDYFSCNYRSYICIFQFAIYISTIQWYSDTSYEWFVLIISII